ncbi:hypothetical protein [Litorivicinus lipolyticus]|uniref:hypothetical protein n=1 Tax=Litorivicinus lipolyticus TaxID=418701 RepID=UPI003B5B0DF3
MRYRNSCVLEIAVYFFILFITASLVLSFIAVGDEPDYSFRVSEVTELLGNYYRLDDVSVDCSYKFSPFRVGFFFPPDRCLASIEYLFFQLATGFIQLFSMIALVAFFYSRLELRSIAISALVPGFWIILFAAGFESFAVSLATFGVFLNLSVLSFIVSAFIAFLDPGTAALFICFIFIRRFVFFVFDFHLSTRLPGIIFIIILFLVLFGLFDPIIAILMEFAPSHFRDVYQIVRETTEFDKYQPITRFLGVFGMFGGWFPSNLKLSLSVGFSVAFFLGIVLLAFVRVLTNKTTAQKSELDVISAALFIGLMIAIVPNYSNAKYYLFLLPLFFRFVFLSRPESLIYYFAIPSSILSIMSLAL